MPFSPTITLDSAIAGVRFEVHRIGFGRRTDIDFATLAFRQRLRELEADYPPLSDREKELTEQLEIAKRKSLAVPAEQFEGVIESDIKPLAAELAAAITPDVRKRRAVLDEEYAQVDARIRAQWIRSGLIAITGGDFDGMTADQLLDYGPPDLALEVYAALMADGKLQGGPTKNFHLPTISTGVVGGESPNSTATPAEAGPTPIMPAEIALSTSPAT